MGWDFEVRKGRTQPLKKPSTEHDYFLPEEPFSHIFWEAQEVSNRTGAPFHAFAPSVALETYFWLVKLSTANQKLQFEWFVIGLTLLAKYTMQKCMNKCAKSGVRSWGPFCVWNGKILRRAMNCDEAWLRAVDGPEWHRSHEVVGGYRVLRPSVRSYPKAVHEKERLA